MAVRVISLYNTTRDVIVYHHFL